MRFKLRAEIKTCPYCKSDRVRKFEFGEFWCNDCREWFTRADFERELKKGKIMKVQ